MGDWSLGSVHDTVLDLISDVPASISGNRLLEMADRARNHVSVYTGTTIGSNSISISYQAAITYLTCADVANFMNLEGTDASSVKLGDFSINKGGQTTLDVTATKFLNMAQEELKNIGTSMNFFKSNG